MTKLTSNFISEVIKTLGVLMVIVALGLFIDSKYVAENIFKHAQWINNVLVTLVFGVLYYQATSRTREQLLYALVIAIVGEYLFSIVFGMYTYRLGNIPHYVPPGHAIVFVLVYYFSRKPKIKANRKKIEQFCTYLIIPFSLFFLFFYKDVFGFICTILVFYWLRKYPTERMFYLTMYCVVAILELIGTSFECWKWPVIAFNTFDFLPSANPPAGISLFYFGLDRATVSIYKRRHKETWKRFKRIQSTAVLSK